MLSKQLESSLHRALIIAKEQSHEYATFEHLLFALLEEDRPLQTELQQIIDRFDNFELLNQFQTEA